MQNDGQRIGEIVNSSGAIADKLMQRRLVFTITGIAVTAGPSSTV
jgi:hypothetical protein